MKHSYLDSLVDLAAKITLARSLHAKQQINDISMKPTKSLNEKVKGKLLFLKNNQKDAPVGINFANISARNYSALKYTLQASLNTPPGLPVKSTY